MWFSEFFRYSRDIRNNNVLPFFHFSSMSALDHFEVLIRAKFGQPQVLSAFLLDSIHISSSLSLWAQSQPSSV